VRLFALAALLAAGTPLRAQAAGPVAPDVASYIMDVRLDPAAKTVAGTARISYTNPSPDTLDVIYLHLYLQAFASDQTLWMRESGGQHRGFSESATSPGGIRVEKLRIAGGPSLLEAASQDETLMRVPLPQPLGPQQRLNLDVAWTSTLPRVFARTGYGGHDDTFFMVGQWYPKMAVYAGGAWDTEPWHANAEFFHDFGNYNVTIRAPAAYVIAGAGVPLAEPQTDGGERVWRFSSESVTDYAFAASPDFRTRRQASANGIDVWLFYLPEHASVADEYMRAATGAVAAYSAWYGQYPHPRLTVVDVPDSAAGAGGMEYPTLVTGGTIGMSGSGFVSYVTAHEIGHQWWPMQTATNEGREPWLDEGLTEYTGSRFLDQAGVRVGVGWLSIGAITLDRLQAATGQGQALDLPAWQYSDSAYAGAVYGRTALGLWTLERLAGTERFRAAMAAYLTQWRFRHPTAADFRTSIEQSLGPQPWFFDQYAAGAEIGYAAGRIANGPQGATAELLRTGDVTIPVDVRVTLASGAIRQERWDGVETSHTLRYPGEQVTSVVIDPEHALVAERDVTDNGASTEVQAAPAVSLAGQLAALVQTLAQLLGSFG
jgi:hypothetical protein